MSPIQNLNAGSCSAKRLPTQTTPYPSPARVAGHYSQLGLARTPSATLKRPPVTPATRNSNASRPGMPPVTPATAGSNASRPGIPPLLRGRGWGIGVDTPSLAHHALPPASYFMNRALLMHDASIMARSTLFNATAAPGGLPLAATRSPDGRRASMPLNVGPGPSQLPPNMNFGSRPLSYTARKGRKMPSRSLVTASVSSSRKTTPLVMRSRTPLEKSTTAGANLQNTNKAESAVPVKTYVEISDDETPQDNSTRNRKKPVQANVHSNPTPSSAPTCRRRRFVIVDDDDDEDEDNDYALLKTPSVTRSFTRKRYRSPSTSSSSDGSLAQTAQNTTPPQLTSVRTAMGEANWTEYVGLTESFIDGKMSELEFGRMASRIFRVEHAGTRDRIQRLVLKMVRDQREE
ncbi:hypothetical protein K505DRAFT_355816 [Melanomma pulvis-pyrius CBS 109.77]|uniref:Uncharacterized protein n=1 Tax=Melanomma pulvis-pyrius CBS 109.77 TaxID=1314802 RepID=A0A6A6XVG9_9PLEO|nr:hypothetical protein K505DRAFT_355816 [Melanomma pulvis-pyrius CBS 109.77]